MTVTTYPCRLFGGRAVAVNYDNVAGTITIMGQSLTISTLSTALQNEWTNAVATTTPGAFTGFAGNNISSALNDILSATPTWAASIRTVFNNYTSGLGGLGGAGNQIADPETWQH